MKFERFFRQSMGLTVLAFFLGLSASAQIIPTNRLTVWQPGTSAGVSGGIPHSTNIFVNLLTTGNSSYKCYGDGIHDDTAAINSAIANCPAGEVIYAPAATYLITGELHQDGSNPNKGQFTLRGDGMGKTIFLFNADNQSFFGETAGQWEPPTNQTANIVSGLQQGSTAIILDHVPDYATYGVFLLLDELNDNTNVTGTGSEGLCTWGDRNNNGTRNVAQLVRMNVISGNTVNFTPPLNVGFSTNLSPQATTLANNYAGYPEYQIGLEDFTVTNISSTSLDMVVLAGCRDCWVKDVEFAGVRQHDVFTSYTLQCEFRDCYFHDAYGFTVGNGYGITAISSYNCLYENNIFSNLYCASIVEAGSGNVIDYNYCVATHSYPTNYMIFGFSASHSPQSSYNLYEGNVGNEIQSDFAYGSSGCTTIFRNWMWGTDAGITANGKAISLDAYSLSNNVVGNVLGLPTMSYNCYMMTNGVGTEPAIYRIGYPEIGNDGFVVATNAPYLDTVNGTSDFDTRVLPSTLIDGNYDYATRSTIWDSGGVQTIPASLIYTNGAPLWWSNSVPWPPIGPDVSGMTNAIPAQLRFYLLTHPSTTLTPPPINGSVQISDYLVGPATGSAPLTVTVQLSSRALPNCLFDFGDGTMTTNQTHVYTVPGIYTVIGYGISSGNMNKVFSYSNAITVTNQQ